MAKKVVWTERASDDLHRIFEQLSVFSDVHAERVAAEIIDRTFLLENFPNLGRVVPELNIQNIRELVVERYRIVYAFTHESQVEILAVRHSAQALSSF
jgi:toxin ParE1/3/4